MQPMSSMLANEILNVCINEKKKKKKKKTNPKFQWPNSIGAWTIRLEYLFDWRLLIDSENV